jgi:hypothetical protein
MRQALLVILLVLLPAALTAAQEEEDNPGGLRAQSVSIVTVTDAFGQEVQRAEGQLVNRGSSAYENITLFADLYDEDGDIVGEGIGFPVNACGIGLLPSFALQPGRSQTFSVSLEPFEDDIEIDHVEIEILSSSVDPLPESGDTIPGIRALTAGEVVNVEWLDERTLRFAAGCHSDVFTALDWFRYNLSTGWPIPIVHPDTSAVTEALLRQLGLLDPVHYNHSMLTFPVNARRIVYQTELHDMFTAEPDGSFKRLISNDLYRHSLRGFIWLPEGRFLAYYFGAYGEEVRYLTASVDGQRISSFNQNTPSQTIPGPTIDATFVIMSTSIDDITGYYYLNTRTQDAELLFEADPPGNNWPAPIFTRDADGDAFVYFVRPVEGQAQLQCLDMQTRDLHDLTTLALQISTDERARAYLSPDGSKIALAADGVNGGLWLVDLSAVGACGG